MMPLDLSHFRPQVEALARAAKPAEPPMNTDTTGDLTDYRLANDLCVWCGNPNDGRSDLFDTPDCQEAWHARRNGQGATFTPKPCDVTSTPPAAGYSVADVLEVAEALQQADDVHATAALIQALSHRPGMLAPRPAVGDDNTVIGPSVVAGHVALREIVAEPVFDVYPHRQIALMATLDKPWERAIIPRYCANCERATHPVSYDSGVGWQERCRACALRYPGATVVAMARGGPTWGEYAAVTYRGYRSVVLGGHQQGGTPVPMPEGYLWEGCRRKAVEDGLPMCHCRGCEDKATTWYLVGAHLNHAHSLWVPRDEEPLRVGMCDAHAYALRVAVRSNHLDRLTHDVNTGQWFVE